MTPAALSLLAQGTLLLALRLAAPVVLACAVAGLLVGLFQSATQAQEPSLGFVSKLAFAAGAIFLSRTFVADELLHFSSELLHQVALVAR